MEHKQHVLAKFIFDSPVSGQMDPTQGRCIDVFVGLNCLYLETHNMVSKQAVQK